MPEIAHFVKQLLEEDEFGTDFHANIYERVAQLNLPQLTKMHAHLEETTANAQFHVWREANSAVDQHYAGFLAIRQDEFNKVERDKRDREKKIEFRLLRKEALKKEEDKVKGFLESHCYKLAVEQIHEEEKTRKAEERARIRLLVYQNERKRNRLLAAAVVVLILGIAVSVVLFRDTLLMMVSVIMGTLFIAGVIVAFTIITTRLEVYDTTEKQLGSMVEKRAAELKFQAENELIQKEEVFNRKQLADKDERRVRKRALREQREVERQIAEMDQEERRLQGLDSEYSLATGASLQSSVSPPRRLPPMPSPPRHPILHPNTHLNPSMQGSMATFKSHGTQGGTLGSDRDLGADSHPLWPRQRSEDDSDDDEDSDYYGAVAIGEDSLTLGGVGGSRSASTLGGGGMVGGGSGASAGKVVYQANMSFNSRESLGMQGAVAGGGSSFRGSMSNVMGGSGVRGGGVGGGGRSIIGTG